MDSLRLDRGPGRTLEEEEKEEEIVPNPTILLPSRRFSSFAFDPSFDPSFANPFLRDHARHARRARVSPRRLGDFAESSRVSNATARHAVVTVVAVARARVVAFPPPLA